VSPRYTAGEPEPMTRLQPDVGMSITTVGRLAVRTSISRFGCGDPPATSRRYFKNCPATVDALAASAKGRRAVQSTFYG
jgi:hypothetical protein